MAVVVAAEPALLLVLVLQSLLLNLLLWLPVMVVAVMLALEHVVAVGDCVHGMSGSLQPCCKLEHRGSMLQK